MDVTVPCVLRSVVHVARGGCDGGVNRQRSGKVKAALMGILPGVRVGVRARECVWQQMGHLQYYF